MNKNLNKDVYTLMYKDKIVGELCYDYVYQKFSFTFNEDYDDLPPYPLVRWGESMKDKVVSEQAILDWLEDRVIMKCRPEVKEILEWLKLYEYDVWDIARRNSGMSVDDFFWLTKDTTLDYKTFNTRYCRKNGIDPVLLPPFPIMKYPTYFERLEIMKGKEWKEEYI